VFNILLTITWRHTGDGGIAPPLFSSALGRGEWFVWCLGKLGPRVGLEAVEWRKIPCLCREFNPLCRSCSLSLYRLSYRESFVEWAYREYYKLLYFSGIPVLCVNQVSIWNFTHKMNTIYYIRGNKSRFSITILRARHEVPQVEGTNALQTSLPPPPVMSHSVTPDQYQPVHTACW
jgi:hypothetical protein